jgi:xanthine dehydrogenase accessory factor
MYTIFKKLLQELKSGGDAVLVTIIQAEGSTPRGVGAQMVVGSGGRICGTIGGGSAEKYAEEFAGSLLREKRSATRFFPLHQSGQGDIGMICGGDITVYFQYVPSGSALWRQLSEQLLDRLYANQNGFLVQRPDGGEPALLDENGRCLAGAPVLAQEDAFVLPLTVRPRVILFGAGHIAEALGKILDTVGFRVTVYDDRPEYVTPALFPTAEQRICGAFSAYREHLTITPEDYIAVMTADHANDFVLQEQLLRGEFAYLGVIGSKAKHAAVNRQLLASGITQAQLDRMHAPIGLPIKSTTSAEIAVSIAAELILVRAERRSAGEW